MKTEQDKIAVFNQTVSVLARLGFKLGKVEWAFDSMANANIKLGSRNVARMSFHTSINYASLRIHPLEAGSYKIMAGNGMIKNQEKLDAVLNEVETLFRAMLVLKGKMDYYEFPTDAALTGWIAKLSEMDSDGPEYWHRVAIETSTVESIVGLACELRADFDREKALRLHAYVMDMAIPFDEETELYERASYFIHQSAIAISDTLFQHAEIALREGSGMAYLYTEKTAVPVRNVPELELEMVQSLTM